jgi:hypothetical protein
VGQSRIVICFSPQQSHETEESDLKMMEGDTCKNTDG